MQRHAHDVADVALEDGDGAAGLNVPQRAGGVAGRGEDLPVIEEAAGRQEATVAGQLAHASCLAALAPQAVDRANIVEATAGDERARR